MINLLPPRIKEARRFGRHNITLLSYILTIAAIGLVSIGIILFNMRYVSDDEKRLKAEMSSRDAETKKLEAGQKEVENIAAQLKTIDKLYSGEVKFSELVPKIGGLLPKGAVLSTLSLVGGKNSPLQLNVNLETQNLAAVFQQNLVNSELFSAADISSIITTAGAASKPGVKIYPYSATLTASFKGAVKQTSTKGTAVKPWTQNDFLWLC